MGGWGPGGLSTPSGIWARRVPGGLLVAWAQGGEGGREAGSGSGPGVRGDGRRKPPHLSPEANFQLRFPKGPDRGPAGAWIREAGSANTACKRGWGFVCALPRGNIRIVYSR